MLESILRQAGYRVGLYIKPHFVRFNERARIDGVEADDDALIAQFEAVDAARRIEPVGRADVLRVHDARDPAAVRADARSTS